MKNNNKLSSSILLFTMIATGVITTEIYPAKPNWTRKKSNKKSFDPLASIKNRKTKIAKRQKKSNKQAFKLAKQMKTKPTQSCYDIINNLDPNITNKNNETLFRYIILEANENNWEQTKQLLSSLINKGANIESPLPDTKETVLGTISYSNDTFDYHKIKFLLENKANINTYAEGNPLLHNLILSQDIPAIKLACNYGANLFAQNQAGQTALELAQNLHQKHENQTSQEIVTLLQNLEYNHD